jgi:hypothetical protein
MTMADLVRGRTADIPRAVEPAGSGDASWSDAPDESAGLGAAPAIRAEPSQDLRRANDAFHRAVAITDKVLRSLRARTSFSATVLEAPLEALLESVQTSDILLLPFFNPGGGSGDAAETVVNACVLAMKIGTLLSYTHDALLDLGVAALLHQAGVARASGEDTQLVQGLKVRYPGAAAVLAQLREHPNGAGATADVEDTDSREPAHIVGLAGIIEGLVRRRPVRSGVGHAEIIKDVLKRERGTYPHQVLKALIRILATLPVGSLVRLNTGEICRVAAKKDGFPLRPILTVLVRQHKRVTEPNAIDLSQHPFLHIQGFVTEAMLNREAEMGAL